MLEFCPSFCPNRGREKIAEGWEEDAAWPGIHAGLNDDVFLLKGREGRRQCVWEVSVCTEKHQKARNEERYLEAGKFLGF